MISFEDIKALITFLGGGVAGGWILNWYKAKPEKTHLELDNVREAMNIQKDLISALDKRVSELSQVVAKLHHRVEMKHEIIYSAYGCKLIKCPDDCIVITQYNKRCGECTNSEAVMNDEE